MATPGYVFRDGGPIPDSELEEKGEKKQDELPGEMVATATRGTPTTTTHSSPINTPTSSRSAANVADAPTDSHALANADHEEKGAAQEAHFETEVKDLGWNDHPKDVPKPLVGGLRNEELWLLVRRFNKVRHGCFMEASCSILQLF